MMLNEMTHRHDLAAYVQTYMPVYPRSGARLKFPLRYLIIEDTDRESLPSLVDEELDMSAAIKAFQDRPDIEVVNEIKEELNHNRREKYRDGGIQKIRMITGTSGSGKSIYLGKIISRLIGMDNDDGLNSKHQIFYSQLKDVKADEKNKGKSLWESIQEGFDNPAFRAQLEDITEFCKRRDISKNARGVIFIDSLDEITTGNNALVEEWEKVSRQLLDNGLQPIWTCREHNWHDEGLDKIAKKMDEEGILDEQPVPELERPDWKEISPSLKERIDSDQTVWLKRCYQLHPLFLTFETNFLLDKEIRKQFTHGFDEHLINQIRTISKPGYNDAFSNIKQLSESIDLKELSNYNNMILYDALSEFMINKVREHLDNDNVDLLLDEIGKELYNVIVARPEKLNEILSNEISEKYKKECINLRQMGMLKQIKKDGVYRFSHRSFAEFAVIKYINKEKEGKLGDIEGQSLFNWREPWNGADDNPKLLQEFLKRTGSFITIIEPMKSLVTTTNFHRLTGQPWKTTQEHWTYKLPEGHFEETKKLLSKEQRNAVQKQAKSPLLLSGFPGTGKTFTGVEMMIGHINELLKTGKKNKKGLIVTLNSQLADSIESEIPVMHKESAQMTGNRKISDIMEKIEIGSVEKIISDWAPDFKNDCEQDQDGWLIKIPQLRKLFDDINVPGVSSDKKNNYWRSCLDDYHNYIYDNITGNIIDEEVFLEKSNTSNKFQDKEQFDPDGKKIAQKWHQVIKKISTKQLSVNMACIILRNRFIHHTYEMKTDSELKKLFKEFPVKSPFQKEISDNEIVKTHTELISKKQHYETILVDEIQDLPPQFAILSSFMCPNRGDFGHKLMFVGDENQALNQDHFDWENWIKKIKDIVENIITSESLAKENLRHKEFHLLQLANNDVTQLVDNHRNPKSIVKIMEDSTAWLDGEKISMQCKKEDVEEVEHLKIVTTKSWDEWEEIISDIMAVLNSESSISLVITDPAVRDYIIERMEELDKKRKIGEAELFDTWTIKGLERPSIVVIGGWIVSKKGEFFNVYKQCEKKKNPEKYIEPNDRELMRSRMLVALSRATQKTLVITGPEGLSNGRGLNSYDKKFLQLKPPIFENRFLTNHKVDENEIRNLLKPHHYDKDSNSIIALTEGLQLLQRSETDADLKGQIPRFYARWSKIVSNDGTESNLRKLFEYIDDYVLAGVTEDDDEYENIGKNPLIKLILNQEFQPPKESVNGFMNKIINNSYEIYDRGGVNEIINLPEVWKIKGFVNNINNRIKYSENKDENDRNKHYIGVIKKAIERKLSIIKKDHFISIDENEEDTNESDFYVGQFSSRLFSHWETLQQKDENGTTLYPIKVEGAIGKCLSALSENQYWETGPTMTSNMENLMKNLIIGEQNNDDYIKDIAILSRFLKSVSKSNNSTILKQTFLLYSILPKPNIPSGLLTNFIVECKEEVNNERIAFEKIINSSNGSLLIIDVFNTEDDDIIHELLTEFPERYKIILVKRMIQIKDKGGMQQHNAWDILTPLINKYLNTWLKEITNEKILWKITTPLGGLIIPQGSLEAGSIIIKGGQEELINDVIQVALKEGMNNITDSLRKPKKIMPGIIIDDNTQQTNFKNSNKLAITMLEVVSMLEGFEMIYKRQNDVQRLFKEKQLPKLVETMINLVKKVENRDWVSNTLDTNLEKIEKLIEKDWSRDEVTIRNDAWEPYLEDEKIECGKIVKELIHRWAAHLWILENTVGHEEHREKINKICKSYPSLPKAQLPNGKPEFIPDNNINDIKISVLQDALLDLTMDNKPDFKPMILSNQGFWNSRERKFAPFNISKKDWFSTKHGWNVKWGAPLLDISLAKRVEDIPKIIINISKIAKDFVIKKMLKAQQTQKGKSMNLKTLMNEILNYYKLDIFNKVQKKKDWDDIHDRKWEGWDKLPPFNIQITPSKGCKMSRQTSKDGSMKGFVIDIIVMTGIIIEKNGRIVWDNNNIENIEKGFEEISQMK